MARMNSWCVPLNSRVTDHPIAKETIQLIIHKSHSEKDLWPNRCLAVAQNRLPKGGVRGVVKRSSTNSMLTGDCADKDRFCTKGVKKETRNERNDRRSDVALAHPWRDGGEGVVRHRNILHPNRLRRSDLPAKCPFLMAGWRAGCMGLMSQFRRIS
jgi:hypothetical protein